MARKRLNNQAMTMTEQLRIEIRNANRRLNRIAETEGLGVESETYKLAVERMRSVLGKEFEYTVKKGKSKGEKQFSWGKIHKAMKDDKNVQYMGDRNIMRVVDELRVKQPKTVKQLIDNAKTNLGQMGISKDAVTRQQAIEHVENLTIIDKDLSDIISNYYELKEILEKENGILKDTGYNVSEELQKAYDKVQDLLEKGERDTKNGQLTDHDEIQEAIDTFKGVLTEFQRVRKAVDDEKKGLANKIADTQKARGYGRDYKRKK